MNYCTRYSIFSKDKEQAVFNNFNNTACFAEFTSINFSKNYKEADFSLNNYLELYLATKNYHNYTPYTESITHLIEWWTEVLNNNLFPVTLTKRVFQRTQKNAGILGNMSRQEYYVWKLDFAEYSSKAHVKFGLYFLRYIYEYTQYKIIEAAYEYCKIYPEANPLEVFGFMTMFDHKQQIGHCITYTGKFVDYNVENIKQYLDSIKNNNYTNFELSNLHKVLVINSINLKTTNLTKDSTWEEYKKQINLYKK